MDFLRNILQIPSSVSVSMKLPKFKKLRQWSHDSIVNLSQLTGRTVPNIIGGVGSNRRQHSENPLPTTGITTISSAIHEQKIDPKKDNFGLYALKCDRSKSLANARRGILLNLPSTVNKTKTNNFRSVERNHEIFKSCETLEGDDDDTSTHHGKLYEMSQQKEKRLEPPPRKKKKIAAPHINALHHKPKQQVYKAGQSMTMPMDSLEKNDSGLYRIVGATANITYVEPKKKTEGRSVAVVRPKVEKAMIVKSTPKVKDYEWHKDQRRPSKSKIVDTKKSCTQQQQQCIEVSNDVKKKSSEKSVDIFKANRSVDKENMFDEFDELFEKNKTLIESRKGDESEIDQTPELAFKKLKELKKFSPPSRPLAALNEDIKVNSIIKNKETDNKLRILPRDKNLAARAKYVNSLLEEEDYDIIDGKGNSKPKIISEQVKERHQQHVDVNKKKIMYYNDENEMQEMIMKRVQTTETSTKLSTMDVKDYDTERAKLNENQTSVDYKHPTQLVSTNISSSNSLRRTIFVFNL